jgi:hypothetical protein
MKHNAGGIDRATRVVVGLALLSAVFVVEGDNRWWGLIGLLPLFTGLAGNCPAYSLLGVSTCPVKGSAKR